MAKFSGYLNLGVLFGQDVGSYLINSNFDYFNKAAMIVDTMMQAGMSLFQQAEVEHHCCHAGTAEASAKKACAIMNTIYAWKTRPEKRPPECAASWLDDAWCTLNKKYREIHEKEII